MDREEIDIINKAKAGDKYAIDRIFKSYTAMIHKLKNKYAPSPNDENEFIQEGNIALFRAILKFDTSKNMKFSTFLFTCINNAMISLIRQKFSKKKTLYNEMILSGDVDDDIDANSLVDVNFSTPEMEAIEKEREEEIKSEIENTLSDKEKDILNEYLANHSYKKIADNLGISVKSVENAIGRIRKKLKYLL